MSVGAGGDLLKNNALILSQILYDLGNPDPKKAAIVIVAGSPCQDVTSAGQSQGILGCTGPKSRQVLIIYALLLAIQTYGEGFLNCAYVILENAGSIQPVNTNFLQQVLRIPETCCHNDMSLWEALLVQLKDDASSSPDLSVPFRQKPVQSRGCRGSLDGDLLLNINLVHPSVRVLSSLG